MVISASNSEKNRISICKRRKRQFHKSKLLKYLVTETSKTLLRLNNSSLIININIKHITFTQLANPHDILNMISANTKQ